MSQDVKLQIFQQIHTPSGNRLTGSYFRSVTGYDTLTSFTALVSSKYMGCNVCIEKFQAIFSLVAVPGTG